MGAVPVGPLFTFGVSWSTYSAGCRTPFLLRSGFGVGVRWWPVGAATTEMLMLKPTLPYANAERPRRSPIAPASRPALPAQPRIIQKSDTHVDIIS